MTTDERPTLLLLHGAGLGAWIWDEVLPALTSRAEALDLPGRGPGADPGSVTLQQCIDEVGARTEIASPVVLVGHSFSAEVALGVAAAYPDRVAGVVLVGGVVPQSGNSFMSLLPPPQRWFLRLLLWRARRDGIRLPRSLVRQEYCSDLDEETAERVLARLTPEAPRLYLDRLDWAALPADVPRYYVRLTNDRSVSPAQQARMVERIQAAAVEELATGHLPMLAQPEALAAALDRLVEAAVARRGGHGSGLPDHA